MLSPEREWIEAIREKNEFLKNISDSRIKMENKIFTFSTLEFWLKKDACGKAEGQQKKRKSKYKQGPYENGVGQKG